MSHIDFHHHFFPPAYMNTPAIRDELAYVPSLFDWTPQRSIDSMDANGTGTALLSLRSPGVWFDNRDEAIALAHSVNDYGTELKQQFKGRFGLFATIPLPDIDAALAEIARAFDELHAEGIGLFTCYGESWLGDPIFFPVLEELNRRKAVVFVHPQPPYYYRWIMKGVPPSAMEYLFDTTRAITSLLYNGAFARFRDIKFIFTHAGGVLPSALARIDRAQIYTEAAHKNLPEGVHAELARLYFDCTTSATPENLGALLNFVPKSHIVFGTDSPVGNPQVTLGGLQKLGFADSEVHDILRGNAERLLPQLARG